MWLQGGFEFFESSSGWIFAYEVAGGVGVISLEPLAPPDAVRAGGEIDYQGVAAAWREWAIHAKVDAAVFVAVQRGPILPVLARESFQVLRLGQEPWMDLKGDIAPRGNHAKGVRAARNQALRAGASVIELSATDLASRRGELLGVLREWRAMTLLELGGCLMSSDPLVHSERRRYFAAILDGAIEAYLVASPVAGIDGWFLEELVYRPSSSRGVSELLMLEAFGRLKASGHSRASLGIISLNSLEIEPGVRFAPSAVRLLKCARTVFRKLYNTEGLELFRRRFNPTIWTDVMLAARSCRDERPLGALGWLRVVAAIVRVHRPRIRVDLPLQARAWGMRMLRYSLTWVLLIGLLVPFVVVNRLGDLPESALRDFGFLAAAPLSQWVFRSVVSDFLCYGPIHFVTMVLAIVATLPALERLIRRGHLAAFLALGLVFDDLVKYLLILLPFRFVRPDLYSALIHEADVGMSLVVMTIAGLWVNQLRRWREPLFILTLVLMIFGLVLALPHMHAFILSLDHFLFFAIGYGIGKARFEWQRRRDREVSRGKGAKSLPREGDRLRLIRPSPKYRDSYLAALRAWREEGLEWHLEVDERAVSEDFSAFVRAESSRARRAPAGLVRESIYWGLVDNQVVGRIGIRHELNERLRAVGGHIGYDVSPAFRRRGFATAMLSHALKEAAKLGLTRVLITCDDTNEGSIRVIEACGGKLEKIVEIDSKRPMKRHYWINVSPGS